MSVYHSLSHKQVSKFLQGLFMTGSKSIKSAFFYRLLRCCFIWRPCIVGGRQLHYPNAIRLNVTITGINIWYSRRWITSYHQNNQFLPIRSSAYGYTSASNEWLRGNTYFKAKGTKHPYHFGLSANAMEQGVSKLIEAWINDYIFKPFKPFKQ
jgi:hypothetical protein